MSDLRWGAFVLLAGCAAPPAVPLPAPVAGAALARCHEAYLSAGSDGPKLLLVDAMVVDSTTSPPVRCGQLRSAHPAIKSAE